MKRKATVCWRNENVAGVATTQERFGTEDRHLEQSSAQETDYEKSLKNLLDDRYCFY